MIFKFFILVGISFAQLFSAEMSVDTSILISQKNLNINQLAEEKSFKTHHKDHLNLGFSPQKKIYIKIDVKNLSQKKIEKVLVVDNPLLEKVFLYDKNNIYKSGMLYFTRDRKEIFPSFSLSFEPNEQKVLYLHVENKTTTLQFGFSLLDEKEFIQNDKIKQFSTILFIGLLSAFIIYSFFLFFYTKDKSYYLYSFYLFILMFQQLTYIGFLPLYAPPSFVYWDNLLVVPKVSLMIIAAALFAKYFLKMKQFKFLNRIYKTFIFLTLVQIPIVGTQFFYLPEITICLGFVFVIFNTFSGIYVYIRGNRQARFFIVGWIFLLIGYFLMILDALGFLSYMNKFPELILWLTVIEAIFLMLAFVDKLSLLSLQKKELDEKLLNELKSRQKIVELEVVERTNDLQMALEEKVVLFRELNHRVKNNLQLILSIIRLQRFDIKDKQSTLEFEKLENRIKAISKTHELLCDSEDIVEIDMNEYISELYNDVNASIMGDLDIDFDLHVNVTMFLRQAVYVGLILNELLSNSIKHAFKDNHGTIHVNLYKKNNTYVFIYKDSGQGYKNLEIQTESLGLKLVNSLVTQQLEGTMSIKKDKFFEYLIKFNV